MKTIFMIPLILFASSLSLAEKHEHREHGAHEHGSAELGLAFEAAAGKIEFKSPADSIVGFEHKATKPGDKKKLEAALKTFESKIGEMISFDEALKCRFNKEKLESVFESESHSDVVANFTVSCAKSPVGTTITFNFQKVFPKLKDVDAQVIVDNLQKSIEIKNPGTKLELK